MTRAWAAIASAAVLGQAARMTMSLTPAAHALLLRRRGLVVPPPPAREAREAAGPAVARGLALELAAVGAVPTSALEQAWAAASLADVLDVQRTLPAREAQLRGGMPVHTPLYPNFPHDVPASTQAAWWQRVLVHYLQSAGLQQAGQPCLTCASPGNDTHPQPLSPCGHVVCSACFDGSTVTGCPVCGAKVDRAHPFFQTEPAEVQDAPSWPSTTTPVRLRLLTRCDDPEAALRTHFVSLCERMQALSPDDQADLQTLAREKGAAIVSWLPAKVPVRENIAWVFGTLLQSLPFSDVLPAFARTATTATDLLRTLAVFSGAQPSLAGAAVVDVVTVDGRPAHRRRTVRVLRLPKLPRPARRAILTYLESLPKDALIEDMQRHRSAWLSVGERVHPHEWPTRFPNACAAFFVLRGTDPSGAVAPPAPSFASRVEARLRATDLAGALALLRTRPGELGRRVDELARAAGPDPEQQRAVIDAFAAVAPSLSPPVLLALYGLLPRRRQPLPAREIFPKGDVGKFVAIDDTRAPLSPEVIAPLATLVEETLLARVADKGAVDLAVIDAGLADIAAPFNERTASKGGVALPRGSVLDVPTAMGLRLFLHWCEPENGSRTDIDLSVGFYNDAWHHSGVCSYYQTRFPAEGPAVAVSSGDFTSAPYPDGASEFVDVDIAAARAAGHRYAVMVVNAYAGLPFDALARGFAGVMLRDDVLKDSAATRASPFDPRTVALRFDLAGKNGTFLPLCLDLETRRLFWLDGYCSGQFAFNNVANANRDIQQRVPRSLAAIASRARASLFDVACLHAAARAREVRVRCKDGTVHAFRREPAESALVFFRRLRAQASAPTSTPLLSSQALSFAGVGRAFVALVHGDVDVPVDVDVTAYALFHERVRSVAASDLLVF